MAKTMKPLRSVFIESDLALAQRLKPYYQSLFESAGYSVQFHDAPGEGHARKVIESVDPHMIVCDLGFDTDHSGLHLIKALRTHYPDLFVIGTSMGECPNRLIDIRQPSFHMFIDKRSLIGGDSKYIDLTRSRFLVQFRIETNVKISNLDAIRSDEFQKVAAKRELTALVRQIMFSGHQPDELMHPDEVALEPISGGFSGSQVFKMTSRNSVSGIVCVPSVVKISQREYADQELESYHRFVKWGLPYSWRVDLLGSGSTKNYGAIAYSFVLSDLKKFESLTDLLRRNEDARVLDVIGRLFSPDMRRWYGDPLIREEKNIVERYSQRYFRGSEARAVSEKVFHSVVQAAFGARIHPNRIEVAGSRFDLPDPALFGLPAGKYLTCICHGDLNSNNVLVAENEEIIFIDFQETGRAHVFEDFIAMESSVRLYYGIEPLRGVPLLRAEEQITTGDDVSDLTGYRRIVAEIRRLARRNFPSESFETYYYASAAFNFRLLRIKSLTPAQTERVVAALLASLNDLAVARSAAARASASAAGNPDPVT